VQVFLSLQSLSVVFPCTAVKAPSGGRRKAVDVLRFPVSRADFGHRLGIKKIPWKSRVSCSCKSEVSTQSARARRDAGTGTGCRTHDFRAATNPRRAGDLGRGCVGDSDQGFRLDRHLQRFHLLSHVDLFRLLEFDSSRQFLEIGIIFSHLCFMK